ncbi:MAG: inner membrane protein, partial [Bacteroidia bacterium]
LSVIALSFMNRTSGWRKRINYLGLGLSSAYLIVGLINKYVATSVFEADLKTEPEKKELMFVGTTPLNVALWYGVAETESAFHIGYYSLFDDTKNVSWVGFDKNHNLISDIENEYGVDRLKWFSDQLYVVTEANTDTLNFYTLKFGRSKFESETPDGSFLFYMKIVQEADGSLTYQSIREPDVDKMGEQINGLYNRVLGDKSLFSQ